MFNRFMQLSRKNIRIGRWCDGKLYFFHPFRIFMHFTKYTVYTIFYIRIAWLTCKMVLIGVSRSGEEDFVRDGCSC
jgi:hypothetical protein